MLMQKRWVQRLAGGWLERLGGGFISSLQLTALKTHKPREVTRAIRNMRRKAIGPLPNEAFILRSLAKTLANLPGDYAEVGVYRGGSARMICEAKGEKTLRLFDTFAGIPAGVETVDNAFRAGQYACGRQRVEEYLQEFPNLRYYEGVFPATALADEEVTAARYAMAHLDVDLYQTTLDGLEFFYPRMVPGGVILSHDYSIIAAVRQAFDEFFADKPENVFELPTSQCMVTRVCG